MKLARLGEWLVANGAWMAGHKIALKVGIHGSGFGYGVTARQPLSVGRSCMSLLYHPLYLYLTFLQCV